MKKERVFRMGSTNKVPVYLNIRDELLNDIRNGIYPENSKLPTEHALMEKFNASRASVRSALQSLESAGIIYKKQGAGSFVKGLTSQIRIRIDEFYGFYTMIEQSGHKPELSNPSIINDVLPPEVCTRLNIPEGSNGFTIKRLLTGDGQPAIYIIEYLPYTSLSDESLIALIPKTVTNFPNYIVDFADIFCNKTIDSIITDISSTSLANPLLCQEMQKISKNTLLHLQEDMVNKDGTPIICSDAFINDDMIHLSVINRKIRH